MPDGGPYREAASSERCPRCDDSLELAFDGAQSCLRCGGLWISRATITAAFGQDEWPEGPHLWWRNALPCPTCGAADVRNIMTAIEVDGVMVDRCPQHGLWLDDGELARVMGGTTGALDDLRRRLEGFKLQRRALRPQPAPRPDADARTRAAAEVDRLTAEASRAETRLRKVEAELTAARDRLRKLDDPAGPD